VDILWTPEAAASLPPRPVVSNFEWVSGGSYTSYEQLDPIRKLHLLIS